MNSTEHNLLWLKTTAEIISRRALSLSEEDEYIIGTYMNDVIEVFDYETYNLWLSANNSFGLTAYKISKMRSNAKGGKE